MQPSGYIIFIIALLSIPFSHSIAQQVPDTGFDPEIKSPVYATGKGPLVLVDEAHHNFHTITGRYAAFARILRKDGYLVQSNTAPFSADGLKNTKILVIANAVNEINVDNWLLPTPSAFSAAEIEALKSWVEKGGSLFLIADHMPMAGAAEDLAKAFDLKFYNGFATDTVSGLYPGSKKELDIFTTGSGTLAQSPVTEGRNASERITTVATFTGQAIELSAQATPLLIFNDNYKVLLPDTAWKFSPSTRRLNIKGLSQGAILKYGKGRVAAFGEAAMFTAQLKGKDKVPFGLNSKDAPQNLQFLLNLIHWLDGKI